MRIAIVKPDYGIVGGFELVIATVAAALESDGHEVRWLSPKVADVGRRPFGRRVPDDLWQRAPEFFRLLSLMDTFGRLNAGWADLVVSTQPPSYAVRHPRHLSLFYHHYRSFYDLSEAVVAAGMADPDLHAWGCELVRRVDQPLLDAVTMFLAGSERVRDRLVQYNHVGHRTQLFQAGVAFAADFPRPSEADRLDYPLCVSRHEFPKRTELFVHAMKFLPDTVGVAVGAGGRLGYVQEIDERLSRPDADPAGEDAYRLWSCDAPWLPPRTSSTTPSNVLFEGHVTHEALGRHYRNALCLVAPALDEDYGLTALEAMAYGKPVVVCRDGGNLPNFVDHGVNGFVVEPNGAAIAAAVCQLQADRRLANRMGAAGRDRASSFTWERALHQLRDGVATVAS